MSSVSRVTPYGLQQIALAAQNGPKINVTKIRIGSGGIDENATDVNSPVYDIANPSVEIDPNDNTVIKITGTIPAAEGPFTIGSVAVADDSGVIAVAEGSGDVKRGQDDPFPQAYTVTFMLKVASADTFSLVTNNGDFLPLAGGVMNGNAVIIFPPSYSSANNGRISITSEHTNDGLGGRGEQSHLTRSGLEVKDASSVGAVSAALTHRGLAFGNGSSSIEIMMSPRMTFSGSVPAIVFKASSTTWYRLICEARGGGGGASYGLWLDLSSDGGATWTGVGQI